LEPTPEQRAQFVEVKRIIVKGTRLPTFSVIKVIGIQAGDHVNDASVNAACHRLQSTGLIKSVNYEYLLYPDKPGAELVLTIVDEPMLVLALTEPKQNSDVLWAALRSVDPMFTDTLPPNEKALAFYARNFDACLKNMGRPEEYVAPKLQGTPGGLPSLSCSRLRTTRTDSPKF
jgi:Surface antigen variable number repeat